MDYDHPKVQRLASALAARTSERTIIAKHCFEWVRDEIKHSGDFKMNPTTCAASEVLHHKTGWCFAKSHLLAALLRANRIPAGLCYQRLARNGKTPLFTLHGLNAVLLPKFGWYGQVLFLVEIIEAGGFNQQQARLASLYRVSSPSAVRA